MCEISIEKPIMLKMEMIETDDYTPSIKMLVNVGINHPTEFFKYKANNTWFECSKWDDFTNNLMTLFHGSSREASLKDVSEYFEIKVLQESTDKYQFKFSCKKPEMGEGATNMNFLSSVDSDKLSQLVNSFQDFPKWW